MSSDLSIILGIETTVRELDVRLLIAALHARRGQRIFIAGGLSGQRMVRDLEGALIVGKYIMHPTAREPRAYFDAKKNGSLVIHLAEEGAIFAGAEADWAWNLDHQLEPHLLDPEDFVCTWGDFQRDHYKSKGPRNPGQIRTTGHPRFELCKAPLRRFYEDEVKAIRAKYGKFVLLCSNFGLVNDPEGPFNTFSRMLGYVPEDETQRLRFIGRWSHSSRTFAEFIELFHKLAVKHRDTSFIVRPHPSDNVEFFRWAFHGVENIKVVQEGTVLPWLLASRAMLHNGCTTGLEAHLLDAQIINFRPVEASSTHHSYLPNLFGAQCTTQESAMDAVAAALASDERARPPSELEVPERAARLMANFRTDSLTLFLDVLREAEAAMRGRPRSTSRRRIALNEAKDIATEEGKHLLRRAFLPKQYRTAMHARQRFSGFDRDSVRKKLAKLYELTGNKLDCRFHSRNVIELSSDRAPD